MKIRGFRIEPGEIENCLRSHPDVRDCAVVVREDPPGEKRLVAYVAVVEGSRRTVADWRRYAAATLPGFMVPSGWVFLDTLPLTPQDKVDHRRLPPPSGGAADSDETRSAPESATEAAIAAIWSEVLGGGSHHMHEDFFEAGGNSLLAARILSRIAERFGVELGIRVVFENPTIAGIVSVLAERQGG